MSEKITNQEPVEAPESNESATITIGGQTIERNEDGTVTETVFPVTSSPVETTQETSQAIENGAIPNGDGFVLPRGDESVAPEQPVPTEHDTEPNTQPVTEQEVPVASEVLPETETTSETTEQVPEVSPTSTPIEKQETETIAEVGVAKEAPNQAEVTPAKVSVIGSLVIGATAFAAKILRRKRKK